MITSQAAADTAAHEAVRQSRHIDVDLVANASVLRQWSTLDPIDRARDVLLWCERNGIHTASLHDAHLAVAMRELPSDRQSPADHLAIVRVLVAFLRARS